MGDEDFKDVRTEEGRDIHGRPQPQLKAVRRNIHGVVMHTPEPLLTEDEKQE